MASVPYGGTPLSLENITQTQRLYIDPNLYMDNALKYPFLTFLLQQGIKPVGDWTFNHHTKSYIPRYTQLNASGGASDQINGYLDTWTVDDATVFRLNDLVIVFSTAEIVRVVSLESATSIKVNRGMFATTTSAVPDNSYLLRLGSAARHGEAVSEFATLASSAVANYVQNFKRSVRVSDEMTGVDMVGGDPRTRERAEKLVEMYQDIDNSIILNQGGEHITTGYGDTGLTSALGGNATANFPLYATNGIRTTASTYSYDNHSSGITRATVTEAAFNTMDVAYLHAEAPGETLPLFCSMNMVKCFNYWGRANIRYGPSDTIIGINVMKYQADGGMLEIIPEPQLKDYASGYGYNGAFFTVLPGKVQLVGIPQHNLTMHEDTVKDGSAQTVDEWRWGIGLNVINEKYVTWGDGISGPSTS